MVYANFILGEFFFKWEHFDISEILCLSDSLTTIIQVIINQKSKKKFRNRNRATEVNIGNHKTENSTRKLETDRSISK